MADEQHSEEVQRWTAKRRAALVLNLLKGETTAARRHGLKVAGGGVAGAVSTRRGERTTRAAQRGGCTA
jgi:hypothetical protein